MNETELQHILAENNLDWNRDAWTESLDTVTDCQVLAELDKTSGKFSLQRLMTLVSPAAEKHLEQMAQQARLLTIQRFGRTIQLYAPLYVSNVCVNRCKYCGYNQSTDIVRTQLTIDQAMADAEVIAAEGFRHILLVSGEDKQFVTIDYLSELARRLQEKFSSISIEIHPLSRDEYAQVFKAGIEGVALYQETYDREVYADYHLAGPKRDYDNRLASPGRFADAGMRKLGLGFLLGLANWRVETLALAQHAAYLMKHYWRAKIDFSFPRICPATNVKSEWPHLVSDKNMVQMMLALRLCFADAGIVLSTRENVKFRDHMMGICVTRVSAGSKTNPGGYGSDEDAAEQFSIDDDRTAGQMAAVIEKIGYEPVWKDWDAAFSK